MSKLKVDQVEAYSVTDGINFPNGIKVGTTQVKANEVVAEEFIGISDPGIGYAYPSTTNSMTSKRYVDDSINALLPGAGLSGVSKQYVDTGLSAAYVNSTNYTNNNFMRKNAATEHTTGGITFAGQGPYIITTTGNPSLEIVAAAPVLRLTETDTSNSVGCFHLDAGLLKLGYGSSIQANLNSLAINASGHAGIGQNPEGTCSLILNNRVAPGAAPCLKILGSGDVLIGSGGTIFFDNVYSYSSGSYLDARTAGIQKFKNGFNDRMVISTTNVSIPLSTVSTTGVTGIGALTVLGGVGIGENLNVGGIISGAGTIPIGGVIMWSGSISNIPAGWSLCNGQTVNSLVTPDLRDKFIIGATADNAGVSNTTITSTSTKTGGKTDTTLISHSHTATINDPGHRHYYVNDDNVPVSARNTYDNPARSGGLGGGMEGSGTMVAYETEGRGTGITASISNTGTPNITNANIPPYFSLAYIMRTR